MLVDPLGQVIDLRLDINHPSIRQQPSAISPSATDPPRVQVLTLPSIEAQASPVVLCFATSFQVKDFFSGILSGERGGMRGDATEWVSERVEER